MKIHVLPGDAQVDEFKQTGLEGSIVVCREALIDGNVRAGNLEEFWNVRENFWTEAYPEPTANYRDRVVAEFERLIDLPAAVDVNLWFEYELFCHVNMWFCIWLLRESRANLFRVAPIMQRKDNTWSGFGGLTHEQLTECYDERLQFSDSDIELGVNLWLAYQDRNYGKLRELSVMQSPCFPYLQEACEAEIEKETRPKQILRDLKRNGVDDFGEMFAGFRERAGVYGYGDIQVRRLLSDV